MARRFLDTIDSDAKEYLHATQIFLMRFQETGVPVPPDVLIGRAKAWELIQEAGGLDSDEY